MKSLLKFSDGMTITLKNPLRHPAFNWPKTLLRYPIDFGQAADRDKAITVYDSDGNTVPCQLIYDGAGNCELCFLSSLNPAEVRTFTLYCKKTSSPSGLIKTLCDDSIILFNGSYYIKIPREDVDYTEIPAPVMAVCLNGNWMGNNIIHSEQSAVISVREITFGALFAEYEISYTFSDGGKYTAVIKITAGYDFAEIWESACDIPFESNCHIESRWTGFNATHKYMSTWPDDHWELKSDRYGDYDWRRANDNPHHCYYGEDPRFQSDDMISSATDGEEMIRLAPYAPFFAYSIRPCGAYWDENTGASLGIFVNGNDNWNDGEYSIWASGDKLAGRYFYNNDTVLWKLPIATGKRSVSICCYCREKDEKYFSFLSSLCKKLEDMGLSADESKKLTAFPTTYTAYLHNWYVTLNLDRIKDWQLTYSGRHPEIDFHDKSLDTPDELYHFIISSGRTAIATKGVEEFHERPYTFDAVELRGVNDTIFDSYLRLYKKLSTVQLQEINALLLLTAYICSGEEYMPMKCMLGGHPNFLADTKSVPALIAVMFPEHRDAQKYADVFEKFIDLNTRYHTRPTVKKWGSLGGRWTESIGIYTWAFLTPSLLASSLLQKHYDGKSRMSNERIASIARWIIGLSSAPIDIEGKPVRALSTQGAHSALRAIPRVFRLVGQQLRNFDPLLADNIYSITQNSSDYVADLSLAVNLSGKLVQFDRSQMEALLYL